MEVVETPVEFSIVTAELPQGQIGHEKSAEEEEGIDGERGVEDGHERKP